MRLLGRYSAFVLKWPLWVVMGGIFEWVKFKFGWVYNPEILHKDAK